MSVFILEQLRSDGFHTRLGLLSAPSALRRVLRRSPEVEDVHRGLRQGAITEDTVRQFVSSILCELRLGERLPHDLAIAAIAVEMERWATAFADEFLHDLSRLRLAEMSVSIHVSRECLRQRRFATHNSSRSFAWSGNAEGAPLSVDDSPWSRHWGPVGVTQNTVHLG